MIEQRVENFILWYWATNETYTYSYFYMYWNQTNIFDVQQLIQVAEFKEKIICENKQNSYACVFM